MRLGKVRIAIVLFWMAMTAWLVRYEAFPGWFAHTINGYRGLLPGGPMVFDSWMKITFRDQPIGYSHTRVDTDEKNPAEQYRVENDTLLYINIMGEPQQIGISAEAMLDGLYNLQRFVFNMGSRRYAARIEGRRVGERTFRVRVGSGSGGQTVRVEIPDDVVLYSPFVELSLSRLKPGQHIRLKTLDPASLTAADVIVRATGRETLKVGHRELETTVLAMDFQGLEARAWMDSEGRIVRQETPLGWVMEDCTPEEAMALNLDTGGKGEDVLRAMAIPCKGEITDARACKEFKARLTGVSFPPVDLVAERQTVDAHGESRIDLTVRAARVPARGGRLGEYPEDARAFLKATSFVQSDHPDVVRRAQSIVGSRQDPVDMAQAIYEWVYRKVKKTPAAGLPSALDVLRQMEGDCNEHTYLFVALARAAGLPAQIRVGLLYNEGVFYYHAWPAVYVGEWWEMDPTIGQEAVDATHIALLEGELASQLKLLSTIGRLNVEVLSQAY